MNKLIEIAKSRKGKNDEVYSKEEIELALGWVKGEYNVSGVSKALSQQHGTGSYVFLARALKQYILAGK